MTNHSLKKALILLYCFVFLSTPLLVHAAAPVATTGSADPIGPKSATLKGQVNPNSEETAVTFEYNTSGDFGGESPITTVTADESPLTGTGDQAVSKAITGLTAGTRYHYRVVGVNASDTDYGNTIEFVTDMAATAVTDPASSITDSGATLNGIVNALDESTIVTFEYGTTISYGSSATATQSPVTGNSDTAVSAALGSLPSDTLYNYRVIATNTNGTVYGSNLTFFTSTPAAPTAVTDYPVHSYTPNGVTLMGTVNANNDSTAVTFQYGLTTAYVPTVTADQSPLDGTSDTEVSKLITGLTPDTTYHYRVVATNGINTTYGDDITFYNTVAPDARTTEAAGIYNSGAVLHGVINPKTLADDTTTGTFEYGLTASYGDSITWTPSPIDGGGSPLM